MTKRLIETPEKKLKREREGVVKQLEGARREVTLVKKWLDAPKEDPYWENWNDLQIGKLAILQKEATELQLKIRELTLEFVLKDDHAQKNDS